MEDFTVIDFELALENYPLEDMSIDKQTIFFCTLYVDNNYVTTDEDRMVLKASEAKLLQGYLDMHLTKAINTLNLKSLRPLLLLDELAQVLEKALLLYSDTHPHIQVVEIALDTIATTYSNPAYRELLESYYQNAKEEFMEMMNLTSDEAFEEFLLDTYNQMAFAEMDEDFDNYDVFADEATTEDAAEDEDDDKPDNGDNILIFPNDRLT